MTATTLMAIWSLGGPVRPEDRHAVASLRRDQALALPVEERELLMRLLEELSTPLTTRAVSAAQDRKEPLPWH